MTFGPKTEGVLYHYTSHKNLRCIVEDRRLRISHVYYMNDANEIKYGAELFKTVVAKRQNQETNQTLIDFLVELKDWTNQLIGLPHYIFVFSLTEKGNLLSQWRAYTPSGEAGVSIGFSKEALEKIAAQKGFELIKCLYDKAEQLGILNTELDAIIAKFVKDQPSINTSGRPPNQKYLSYFYRYSERLLKMFCRTKDPFFQEESEWRLVSKYYETYTDLEIKFREGRTTLVPFIEFHLSGMHDDNRLFEQVYVGPSPNFNLAYAAIASFLSNKKACNITINSQSPLREL
jgi:Protein of unknown function (DUF2971)